MGLGLLRMYRKLYLLVILLVAAQLPLSANAFSTACGSPIQSPVCPLGWAAGEATFHTAPLSTAGSGLSSAQLESAFSEAMDRWTNSTNFEFIVASGSANPCLSASTVSGNPADNDNGFTFGSTTCLGSSFQPETLAVATILRLSSASGNFDGAIVQSGVVFNSDQNWDIYSGPQGFNTSFDFTRVAVHELGHSLGLAHTQPANSAIMLPIIGGLEVPQSDDLAGAAFLYGAVVAADTSFGFIPAILMLLLDDE